MNALIRGIMILSLLIVATACSEKTEDRVCTYNNVVVSCDSFDQQYDNTTSREGNPPGQSTPTNPSQVAACVTYAVKSIISQADAERLCSRSAAVGYCVADTVRAPISQVNAERLCFESPTLAQCVVETIRGPISQADAERLCRK